MGDVHAMLNEQPPTASVHRRTTDNPKVNPAGSPKVTDVQRTLSGSEVFRRSLRFHERYGTNADPYEVIESLQAEVEVYRRALERIEGASRRGYTTMQPINAYAAEALRGRR